MKKLASLLTINGLVPTYEFSHFLTRGDLDSSRYATRILFGEVERKLNCFVQKMSKVGGGRVTSVTQTHPKRGFLC